MIHATNCTGEGIVPLAPGQPATAVRRTNRILESVQHCRPGEIQVARHCQACGAVENATITENDVDSRPADVELETDD